MSFLSAWSVIPPSLFSILNPCGVSTSWISCLSCLRVAVKPRVVRGAVVGLRLNGVIALSVPLLIAGAPSVSTAPSDPSGSMRMGLIVRRVLDEGMTRAPSRFKASRSGAARFLL